MSIFVIRSMAAPWQGLNYSVSWEGHGIVQRANGLKSIWDCAFKACKKGYRVGFSFLKEAVVVDASLAYSNENSSELLSHLVDAHGGLSGVAFEHRHEAELFVEELEKVISWKLLTREYD